MRHPNVLMRKSSLALLFCLALPALGYAGGSVYLLVMQRELIFEPTREVRKTPADLHLRYETIWVPTHAADGTLLNGWWVPGADPAAPTVLYLHGKDLNIGGNLEHLARLNDLGFSVLMIDYRGFGQSGGQFPSEARVYEDAEAAWSYLISVRHAPLDRTFIYGHSLGSAIALHLALSHREAAGLILESAFTSMTDMGKLRYRFFPINWILNQRFDSISEISLLRMPVLFVHGEADTTVPYSMSQRLYGAANLPKQLLLIPGAGHENSATVGGARYADAVRQFVAQAEDGH